MSGQTASAAVLGENTELHEYDYYEDDFQDELDPLDHDGQPVVTQHSDLTHVPAEEKTPPVEHVSQLVTPGKRTLGERDQYGDDYGDDSYGACSSLQRNALF